MSTIMEDIVARHHPVPLFLDSLILHASFDVRERIIKALSIPNNPVKRIRKVISNGQPVQEYPIWYAMIQRCHNPKNTAYKYYGTRGIYVCDRWRHGENGKSGFECFLSDMGARPDGLQIDRINNDKGYSPDNCRWATRIQQMQNRRGCIWIMHNGEKIILSEVKRRKLVKEKRLSRVMKMFGYTHQEAFDFIIKMGSKKIYLPHK